MGMTMTQKILAEHANLPSVRAGELIEAGVELVMGSDVTTPVAIQAFEEAGFNRVFDPKKAAIVLDHYTPCKDIKSARLCTICRRFAEKNKIEGIFDVRTGGIEHVLLPEQGWIAPGELIVGADSHTCTYGALGAFATGVGSTDMAAVMASGKCWFRVPEAIRVVLRGKPGRFASGKDVALTLIGMLGVAGALYQSLEFTGDGIATLSMDDRFTIANMVVEAGAKNGIFPVDEQTKEYLSGRVSRRFTAQSADKDAAYVRTIEMDLNEIQPMLAMPPLPSNAVRVKDHCGIEINQAVIGSCTNGRLSDMRVAADIMRERHVAPGVRCIVIPATQEIYRACVTEGLAKIFIEAGCVLSVPTCGPCLGGHMGCLDEGESAVAPTNRNLVGRMGHPNSEVILANPAIAAASAIAGAIILPDML